MMVPSIDVNLYVHGYLRLLLTVSFKLLPSYCNFFNNGPKILKLIVRVVYIIDIRLEK